MTAPSYTTDLTDIATADEATGWSEFSGTDGDGNSYADSGVPAYQDNEYPYIQGSYAVTQDCTKTNTVGSLGYGTAGITVPSGGAVFVWHNFSSPFVLGTYAQGGFRILMGSVTNFYIWYVGGRDKETYPYGGWLNHVVDPTVSSDDQAGSPTGVWLNIGSAVYYTSGPSKGEPHQVDVMRYGRGQALFEYGDVTNGYCTIAGFAAENDDQNNRWGLIQATQGGYLWKGLMQFGSASNAVDFRDSNVNIFVQWTPKVSTLFNSINVYNTSSNVEMTGFNFIVLDTTTASKGSWVNIANATVVLTSCTFTDMNLFYFGSNTDIIGCTFTRCSYIDLQGATLTGCKIIDSTSATDAVITSDLELISDCEFVSDGTQCHAIQINTAGTYDLVNVTFDGYASSDGSTGYECIYNNSGGAVTINIIGGDTPTIHNGSGSTTTVVAGAVTVKVTVTDAEGTLIDNARVMLRAANATGPFPYQESVTISNSGTTATVSHTGHGMATNDYVDIKGAEYIQNNGVHQITVTGVDSYTYTLSSAPGDGSVSGTIISTFVALYGLTSSGVISTSRVYSSDQPVIGWARKSSSSPLYKQGPVVGSIDNADGFQGSAILIADE